MKKRQMLIHVLLVERRREQQEEQSQGVRIQNTNEFDPEIEIRTTRRRR
jgi:hypothetical protein